MQGSISIFDFQYTKKVAAMGICDYNERQEDTKGKATPSEKENE